MNQQGTIDLYFKIHYFTEFGKSIYICGNIPALGEWNPVNAFKLSYNEGGWWSGMIKLSRNQFKPIEYKYILNDFYPNLNCVIWENGQNRLIELYVLESMSKQEYFIQEKWSFRTLKFKFKYNLDSKDEAMYIIGSSASLGYWHTPIKMNLSVKQKKDSLVKQQVWTYQLDIDPLNFYFRYYYVRKNEKMQTMIWERGPGRIVQTSDFLKYQVGSPYQHQITTPIKKNGNSFMTYQRKPKHQYYQVKNQYLRQQSQSDYDYSSQGFSFKYYISFGRYNIQDHTFDTHFIFDQINENIYLGPYPQSESDVEELNKLNIKAVLNLQTQYDIEQRGIKSDLIAQKYKEYGIEQLKYEIIDMNVEDFINKGAGAAKNLKKLIDKHESVYVHCTCGIGRAPSTIVVYLHTYQQYSLDDAVRLVKLKRPQFFINFNMIAHAAKKSQAYNRKCMNLCELK